MVPKSIKYLWGLLVIFLLVAGGFCLALFIPPFSTAKGIIDGFSSDGNIESLNIAVFTTLRMPAILSGTVLLLAAFFSLWQSAFTQAWLHHFTQSIIRLAQQFAADSRSLFDQYRPRRSNLPAYTVLAGLTLFAVLARAVFISRPMRHDETYTFMTFVSLPLRYAIADYTLPNNHIFHTFLVHLTTSLLGIHPWAVRLPAALAGALVTPLGYLFARRQYDRHTALLGAALIAAYPILIKYATSARGYSLVTFFSMGIFVCGAYLKHHKNLAVWLLLVLFSALGFYTIPIMLYPVGALFTWLFFSALIKDIGEDYTRAGMIIYLFAAGLGIILLTFLLYLPAIRYSGLKSVLGNDYIIRANWNEYVQILASRWFDLKKEWNLDVPTAGSILLLIGFLLSILLNGRISPDQIPVQLAVFAFIALELSIHRPNPWSRIWQSFLPLYLVWAAAGWLAPLNWFSEDRHWKVNPTRILAAAGLVLLLGASLNRSLAYYPGLKPQPEEVEQTVLFLKDYLQEEDIVLMEPPRDVPIEYYARLYDIPAEVFNRARPFKRAFIIVDRDSKQTLDSVFTYNGSETFFFKLETLQMIGQYRELDIYVCEANWDLVQEEFGKN